MSFYSLPSTIINSQKHSLLEAAYLHYYASDTAFVDKADSNGTLGQRLQGLMGDALILANNAKFDVFNALTMMDNDLFLRETRVSWVFRFFLVLARLLIRLLMTSLPLGMVSSTFTYIIGGLHR